MSEHDLFQLRGMGVKLIEEIREQLAEQGLQIRDGEPVAAGRD
jgi:DNA-directed RNA polymerase alpha subunit